MVRKAARFAAVYRFAGRGLAHWLAIRWTCRDSSTEGSRPSTGWFANSNGSWVKSRKPTRLSSSPSTRPHQSTLRLRIRLDDALHLDLFTTNDGEIALPLSQALHTYFRIGDIHQVHIDGLDGCRYLNTLESWEDEHLQVDAVRFTAETDRIYMDVPGEVSIIDPVFERRITLESRGSASAVVWNPWIDKAARTPQFPDDGWQEMLCIETANVMDDRLLLKPGQIHQLGVTLRSEMLG